MKILRHGWNIRYGNNKNSQNKSNKEKKSSNRNFQMYHGRSDYNYTHCSIYVLVYYTHIDDVVSRDKHGICEWVLLPLRVMLWRRRNMRPLAVIIVC